MNGLIYFDRLSYITAYDLTISAFENFGSNGATDDDVVKAVNIIVNRAIDLDLFTYVTLGAKDESKSFNRTIKGGKEKWKKRINRQLSIELKEHIFPPIDGLYSKSIFMANIYKMILDEDPLTVKLYNKNDHINYKVEKELELITYYAKILKELSENNIPNKLDLFLNNYRIPLFGIL